MNLWKPLRLSILAVNLTAILFVLGKSILDPYFAKEKPYDFPAQVPLSEWQFTESKPIEIEPKKKKKKPVFMSGRKYSYRQNSTTLDIEMRYVVRTNGQVDEFIREHPSIQSSPSNELSGEIYQRQDFGFYAVFTHQQQAYLSACINPRGGSTVTRKQFDHNRETYDPKLSRLIPVLIGKEDWKDYRCLWTYMSVPLKQSSPEEAYSTLETAWGSWNQWWKERFPK